MLERSYTNLIISLPIGNIARSSLSRRIQSDNDTHER